MKVFAPLRTKRLTVNLRELAIGDAIALCKMPVSQNEAGTTELLRRIVEPVEQLRIGQVVDPRLWSVQERAFVVAHYIAQTDQSSPDFAVGDKKFSDYIAGESDTPHDVIIGEVAGDSWRVKPLLGAFAEAIERLVTVERLPEGRTGWWFGAMAAQLWRENEDAPDITDMSDAEIDDAVAVRAAAFMCVPERDFIQLLSSFLVATREGAHLLRIEFTDEGVAFRMEDDGQVPARFCFDAAISESAKLIF